MIRILGMWLYSVATIVLAGVIVAVSSMQAHQRIPSSLILAAAVVIGSAVALRRAPAKHTERVGSFTDQSRAGTPRVKVIWNLMDPPINLQSTKRSKVDAQ